MDKSVIYIATNLVNSKIYIGQTIHYKRRIREHKCYAKTGSKEKSPFHDAIKKYGFENFKFEILEECTPDLLDEREKYWIEHKHSNNKTIGYNITDGGDKGPTYAGVKNKNSILTEDEVLFIRKCYGELKYKNDVYDEFCKKFFNLNKNTFNDVWCGKTYKNVMYEVYTDENRLKHKNQSLSKRPKQILTQTEYVVDIRNRKNKGEILSDVVKLYEGKVGKSTVKDIWYNMVYTEILATEENHYIKNAHKLENISLLKVDKQTGKVIKEYHSLRDAVIDLMGEFKKTYANSIRLCYQHKNGMKSYKGYKWELKENYNGDKN